jgi:hypothetical protein
MLITCGDGASRSRLAWCYGEKTIHRPEIGASLACY